MLLTVSAVLLQAALGASIRRRSPAAASSGWNAARTLVAGRIKTARAAVCRLCPKVHLT